MEKVKEFIKKRNFDANDGSIEGMFLWHLEPIEATENSINFKVEKIPPNWSNPMGKMHGGALAYLMDMSTTLLITALDP